MADISQALKKLYLWSKWEYNITFHYSEGSGEVVKDGRTSLN